MSLRGAYQLRQLVLSWCDRGGASAGVREAVASGLIEQFQSQYPYVHIPDPKETISRGSYPCIRAQWQNGNEISYSVRNKTAEGNNRAVGGGGGGGGGGGNEQIMIESRDGIHNDSIAS